MRDRFGITGDHHYRHAHLVQGVDGLAGLRTYFVGEFDRADDLVVTHDVQDDGPVGAPLLGDGEFVPAVLLEHARPADPHDRPFDMGADPDRG